MRHPAGSPYDVLRGSEATPSDIEAVIALDREAFDARYQVAPEQDLELFRANRESGVIVKARETGEVVGYAMILPVRDEIYEKIRTGRFVDTALTKDMVLSLDRPGEYRFYFAAIVLRPHHGSPTLLPEMLDSVARDFIALAERGVFCKTLTADIVSREGENLARQMGMRAVCRTDHGSQVFEMTFLAPELDAAAPFARQLVETYRRRMRNAID